MDSSKIEVAHDFFPYIRIYKDGRVEKCVIPDFVPPSLDSHSGVSSKDVVITPKGVSARIFLPKIKITDHPHQKLPVLVYFHGGAFCIESAFSTIYHRYVSSLVAEADVVAVSVEYRLAPEHPLPTAFKWVASHSKGDGPEAWLNDHGDLDRVFLAGDSAGANLAHSVAVRIGGESGVDGVKKISGLALIHPYFEGKEPLGPEASNEEKMAKVGKLRLYLCPSTIGCNDPRINAAAGPRVSSLACNRVGVWVAEKDYLREPGGLFYYETLRKGGRAHRNRRGGP